MSEEKGGARHLDPNVKMVWEFPTVLTLAIFWLVASFAYAVFAPENSIMSLSHLLFPFALLLAAAILFGLPIHIWVGMVYEHFTLELAEHDIIVREGVFTRKTTVIPYARIQDIRSERTIIERLFGIATLEIETAGSSKVASQTLIPGIANKNELISEIMRRVEVAKGGDGISASARAPAASAKGSTLEETMAAVLEELKSISSKLDNLPKAEERRAKMAGAKKKSSAYDEYERFRKK